MTGSRDAGDRFDRDLRHAARALVTEDLPPGLFDPAVSAALDAGGTLTAPGRVRARRTLPGFAAGAAMGLLIVATVVTLGPRWLGGSGPRPVTTPTPIPVATAAPVLRSTGDIRTDLVRLRYACVVGGTLGPTGSAAEPMTFESAVCVAPADAGPLQAAVIVGESARGAVVEVHIKSEVVGTDTPSARDAIATTVGKAAAVVVAEGLGNGVASWITVALPALATGQDATTEIDGVTLLLERDARGAYFLIVRPTGAG